MPKGSTSRFTVVPARRSDETSAAKRARRILIVLLVACLLSVFSFVLSFRQGGETVDLSSVEPEGRALADAAAWQVVTTQQVKLPVAESFDPSSTQAPAVVPGTVMLPYPVQSMSWTGFSKENFSDTAGNVTEFEVHHYLLIPKHKSMPSEDGIGSPSPDEQDKATESPSSSATTSPSTSPTESPTSSPSESPTEEKSASSTPAPPTSTEKPSKKDEEPSKSKSKKQGKKGKESTQAKSPKSTKGKEKKHEDSGVAASTSPSPSSSTSTDTSDDSDQAYADAMKLAREGSTLKPVQLNVPILLTSRGPRMAGTPSLSPWTLSLKGAKGTADYSNYTQQDVDLAQPALDQIGRWAIAYATGDGDTLANLTQDPNPNHRYVGLGGFEVPGGENSVQVLSSINAGSNEVVARVRVLMRDASQKAGKHTSQYQSYQDFDLLIGDPTSGQPTVLAWGPAGSAAGLHPYVNRLH